MAGTQKSLPTVDCKSWSPSNEYRSDLEKDGFKF